MTAIYLLRDLLFAAFVVMVISCAVAGWWMP